MVLSHVSDKKYNDVFMFFRLIHAIGPGIMKMVFISIILERAYATYHYKSYENRAPLILAIGLYLFEVSHKEKSSAIFSLLVCLIQYVILLVSLFEV